MIEIFISENFTDIIQEKSHSWSIKALFSEIIIIIFIFLYILWPFPFLECLNPERPSDWTVSETNAGSFWFIFTSLFPKNVPR